MKIKTDSNLKLLEQKILPIIGQVCWQARLGYGGELCLEIGKKIPYDSPLLRNEYKGDWQFGSRGSLWKLDGFMINSDLEEKELLSKLKVIEGTKITKFAIQFEPSFPQLIIEFDNKHTFSLLISPNSFDRDMSCWELFMPNRRIIELYPDLTEEIDPTLTWSDQASDVVVEELVNS